MDNLFLNHIYESIDEIGEFAILFCIPYFKEYKYKYKILVGITEHEENYDIAIDDFQEMIMMLRFLMDDKKLGIYECGTTSLNEFYEYNLNKEETECIMNSITFWTPPLEVKRTDYFLYELED